MAPTSKVSNPTGRIAMRTGICPHRRMTQPVLMRIVREGTEAIVGGSYKSNMIGFGDVLTDDEIASVLGYIKSTWPAEIQGIHNEINARVLP
jgi:hypothetical protein